MEAPHILGTRRSKLGLQSFRALPHLLPHKSCPTSICSFAMKTPMSSENRFRLRQKRKSQVKSIHQTKQPSYRKNGRPLRLSLPFAWPGSPKRAQPKARPLFGSLGFPARGVQVVHQGVVPANVDLPRAPEPAPARTCWCDRQGRRWNGPVNHPLWFPLRVFAGSFLHSLLSTSKKMVLKLQGRNKHGNGGGFGTFGLIELFVGAVSKWRGAPNNG